MGVGVLYGKRALLEAMPPFLTGGEMIDSVTRTGAVFAELPHKFEAGTINAAGAVGLKAAIDYLGGLGMTNMQARELMLTRRALDGLQAIPHVHVLGSDKAEEHTGILTFTIDNVHPHDVSAVLDADHICVRAGHHCAQPLLNYLRELRYAGQPDVLQHPGGNRRVSEQRGRHTEADGLWRITASTMKF